MPQTAILALEDGSIFRGVSFGAPGVAVGELVFNTAMSGYQEILTDPSYARQLVCLTTAHVGNVGVNPEDIESGKVQAEALVVRSAGPGPSSWRARGALGEFLAAAGRPAIEELDTRSLTRHLRAHGALNACLATDLDENEAVARACEFPGLLGMDLAAAVSCAEAYDWRDGLWEKTPDPPRHRVVVYDFGVKRNILRALVDHGCELRVVPARTPAAEVIAAGPDGVVLSNGPGDPAASSYGIEATRALLEARIPLLGICLGHQFLGLASGARTMKTPFGHHGANHPVQELANGRVWITSQNHGFAVDGETLPANLQATHVSLFDGTLQGIARSDTPAIAFQGHPEASPGPHDVLPMFERFVALMERR
ncbi:MAG TPA: glutamine-hydrolyzing carbamoyl-phosphate synthase small subunit [Gammaproteobacteria bacterium]|nr:glutamine-hydrolyzing carbamoyl-phosphate synthase small subunit [Gammaproteobacteria bacterium]